MLITFVFYLNTGGLSRQRSEELITQYTDMFKCYTNITTWVVARDGETKVECVYDGTLRSNNEQLGILLKEINNRIDIIANCTNFEDFKAYIRNWRLSELTK